MRLIKDDCSPLTLDQVLSPIKQKILSLTVTLSKKEAYKNFKVRN